MGFGGVESVLFFFEVVVDERDRATGALDDAVDLAEALDPTLGETLRREVQSFRPRLVVNQARTRDDTNLGSAMRSATIAAKGMPAVSPPATSALGSV